MCILLLLQKRHQGAVVAVTVVEYSDPKTLVYRIRQYVFLKEIAYVLRCIRHLLWKLARRRQPNHLLLHQVELDVVEQSMVRVLIV